MLRAFASSEPAATNRPRRRPATCTETMRDDSFSFYGGGCWAPLFASARMRGRAMIHFHSTVGGAGHPSSHRPRARARDYSAGPRRLGFTWHVLRAHGPSRTLMARAQPPPTKVDGYTRFHSTMGGAGRAAPAALAAPPRRPAFLLLAAAAVISVGMTLAAPPRRPAFLLTGRLPCGPCAP